MSDAAPKFFLHILYEVCREITAQIVTHQMPQIGTQPINVRLTKVYFYYW